MVFELVCVVPLVLGWDDYFAVEQIVCVVEGIVVVLGNPYPRTQHHLQTHQQNQACRHIVTSKQVLVAVWQVSVQVWYGAVQSGM